MGSTWEVRDLPPEPINSLAVNSGTHRTLRTDSPSLTVRIPGPRGCWSS